MDISDKIEFPLAEKQREKAEKTAGITDHLQRKEVNIMKQTEQKIGTEGIGAEFE